MQIIKKFIFETCSYIFILYDTSDMTNPMIYSTGSNQGRSEYLSITRLIAGRFFSWTPLIRWIRNILGETIKNVFTK